MEGRRGPLGGTIAGSFGQFLRYIWQVCMDFVGATEESSKWWKSMFERKILMGEIGFPLRWYNPTDCDVIWEFETLVKNLSQEAHSSTSTKNVQSFLNTSKNTRDLHQGPDDDDYNLNNWFTWFKGSGNNANTNSHAPANEGKGDEEQNGFGVYTSIADTIERIMMDDFPNTSDSNAAQERLFYTEDDPKLLKSRKEDRWHELNTLSVANEEYHVLENILKSEHFHGNPMCEPGLGEPSNALDLRRSVSCPNLLLNRTDFTDYDEQIIHHTRSFSLPSLHQKFAESEQFNRVVGAFGRYVHELGENEDRASGNMYTSHGSPSLGTIMIPWENRINIQPHLTFEADALFSSEFNVQDVELNKYQNEQLRHPLSLTMTENITDAHENNFDDTSQPENAGSESKVRLSSAQEMLWIQETAVSDISKCQMETPILQHQYVNKDDILEHANTCYAESNQHMSNNAVDSECSHDSDFDASELNWNALSSFLAKHMVGSSGGKGRETRAPSSGVDESAIASIGSSVDGKRVYFGTTTLSNLPRTNRKDKRPSSRFKLTVPVCVYSFTDKVRKLILDESELHTTKSLTRVANVGTAYDPRRCKFRSEKDGQRRTDLTEFLRPLKFDVSFEHSSELPNPINTLQQHLGLEKSRLPPEPKKSFVPKRSIKPKPDRTRLQSSVEHFLRSTSTIIRRVSNLFIGKPFRKSLAAFSRTRSFPDDNTTTLTTTTTSTATDDSTHRKKFLTQPRAQRYLTGLTAYKFYRLLAMGSLVVVACGRIIECGNVIFATDYYSNPTESNLQRWKSLKNDLSSQHASDTDVRLQVSKITDRLPLFTAGITLCQMIILIVMCVKFGIDDTGVSTIRSVKLGLPTFLGTETVGYLREPNPWIGPPADTFRLSGAMIASCMRSDKRILEWASDKEYEPMSEENRDYFGCCEMTGNIDRAGTTTFSECMEMTAGLGHWKRGILCSMRPATLNSIAHVIKPCCSGYHGKCAMLSHEHCLFINGIFFVECDHCVQVNCFWAFCHVDYHLTPHMHVHEKWPWLLSVGTRWQTWRFFTAIPITYGFLHLLILMPVHLMLMMPLEMYAGWHRVLIIYVCSSVAGQMMASVVTVNEPIVGSTGGTGGILGVAVLELFQAWKFLRSPMWELFKLLTLIFCFTFFGTLQLVSIASFLTGLCVGMLNCLIFIPYVTFGRRLGKHRLPLILIGLIILIPLYNTVHSLYRYKQFFTDCPFCNSIECINYTNRMCKTHETKHHLKIIS